MNSNKYAIFPFGQVERGAKCVIYGAGRAGQNFFRQVESTQYCRIEFIVDHNWKNIKISGVNVRSIDALADSSTYDYCVISVLDQVVRQQIVESIRRIGVPENKIILPKDNEFDWTWYGFKSSEQEYQYAHSFENYFRQCDARQFISSNRIDVCIRYLLFKDFLNGIENSEHLSLFSRYTLARTGGNEAAYFTLMAERNALRII